MQQAELLRDRLSRECDSDAQRVALAYGLCFGRNPDEQELAVSQSFVSQQGWVQFARAMFNANEFLFIP